MLKSTRTRCMTAIQCSICSFTRDVEVDSDTVYDWHTMLHLQLYQGCWSRLGHGVWLAYNAPSAALPGMLKSTRTRCMTGIQCSICSFTRDVEVDSDTVYDWHTMLHLQLYQGCWRRLGHGVWLPYNAPSAALPGMLKSTRTRCMTGIQCSICSFTRDVEVDSDTVYDWHTMLHLQLYQGCWSRLGHGVWLAYNAPSAALPGMLKATRTRCMTAIQCSICSFTRDVEVDSDTVYDWHTMLHLQLYQGCWSRLGHGVWLAYNAPSAALPGMLKSTRTRCMTGIQCSICSFISRATLANPVCPEWPLCYIVTAAVAVTVCNSSCNSLIHIYRKTEKHWNIWLARKLKSCDIENHGKLSIGCWPSQGLQWSWAWLAFTHCLWSDTDLAGSSYC